MEGRGRTPLVVSSPVLLMTPLLRRVDAEMTASVANAGFATSAHRSLDFRAASAAGLARPRL